MTRRDTIIVAVLINAGLLVVLFISSLKNDTKQVVAKQEGTSQLVQAAKKEVPITKGSPDQVDQILAQYSKKLAAEPVKKEKELLPAVKETKEVALPKEEVKVIQKPVEVAQVIPVEKEPVRPTEQVKVIVKKGDVLEKVAKMYGTTVGAIMQENHLTDSRLQIGQVLYISQNTKVPSPIKQATVDEERYYTVKNGDNLWKIAIEHHLKVEDLLKINQLSEKQAKALRPGDRLRIK